MIHELYAFSSISITNSPPLDVACSSRQPLHHPCEPSLHSHSLAAICTHLFNHLSQQVQHAGKLLQSNLLTHPATTHLALFLLTCRIRSVLVLCFCTFSLSRVPIISGLADIILFFPSRHNTISFSYTYQSCSTDLQTRACIHVIASRCMKGSTCASPAIHMLQP
jgi:hypothetical protein